MNTLMSADSSGRQMQGPMPLQPKWGTERGTWDRVKEVGKSRVHDVIDPLRSAYDVMDRMLSGEEVSEGELMSTGMTAAGFALGGGVAASGRRAGQHNPNTTSAFVAADRSKADTVEDMLDAGYSNTEAWQDVGAYMGPDGVVRKEIPDQLDKFNRQFMRDNVDESFMLDEVMPASHLKGADLGIKYASDMPDDVYGGFTSFKGKDGGLITLNNNLSTPQKYQTLSHEIQHYLQQRDMLASGASPRQAERALDDLIRLRNKHAEGTTLSGGRSQRDLDIMQELSQMLKEQFGDSDAIDRIYQDTMGEVEARDVPHRLSMMNPETVLPKLGQSADSSLPMVERYNFEGRMRGDQLLETYGGDYPTLMQLIGQ